MPARVVALVVGQLQAGGAERQLYELATRLDRRRYDPFVVCLSEVSEPYAGRLRAKGIDVEVLARSRHYDLSRVRALGRLLRRRAAALAHSYLLAANAYTYGASRLSGRLPFVASSRTCIPPDGPWSRWAHRRAFAAASAVIANSRRVMEVTRELYGIPAAKIQVIHNGIDLSGYHAVSGDDAGARAAARADLGLPAGAIVAGSLGRLSPEKNLDLFLDLASRLGGARAAEGDPPIRFALVGDGPAREDLLEAARRRGLLGRVVFAGARHDVPAALSAFDIFVLTSDTEGLPNAVMEAMAAGLPVVATRVGGTGELVGEGATGFLVERGDAAGLADRVGRLAGDPALRRRLGEAGRARVAAEFSVEKMVAATTALYDEVLG